MPMAGLYASVSIGCKNKVDNNEVIRVRYPIPQPQLMTLSNLQTVGIFFRGLAMSLNFQQVTIHTVLAYERSSFRPP